MAVAASYLNKPRFMAYADSVQHCLSREYENVLKNTGLEHGCSTSVLPDRYTPDFCSPNQTYLISV